MKKPIVILFLILLLAAVGGIFAARQRVAQIIASATRPAIPPAVSVENFVSPQATAITTTKSQSSNANSQVPNANSSREAGSRSAGQTPNSNINLAVPFTVQAPHANWDQPYEDACEEASAAMIHYYFAKLKFADADAADAELKREFAWEEETFGSNKDTTAEQTARILRDYYGHKKVEVRYDVTAEDIRRELRAGRPVILPAYGKALGNPFFKNGGPLYHMLVVKGFIGSDQFITNDPGTKRGADYVYSTKTLMNAIHDWNGGDVPNSRKAMIVVYP